MNSKPSGNCGNSDPLVVHTTELAKHVNLWKEKWYSDRPLQQKRIGENSHGNDNLFMGAVDYLAQESGLNERTIARVLACETKTTGFSIAEGLIMAMNMEYLLSPGGPIQVIPNPGWSQERWIEYMEERGCV